MTGYTQQGWQCPECRRVYSPTMVMCMHCGNPAVEQTTTTETAGAAQPAPEATPEARRAAGHSYCSGCFTFGHDHKEGCRYFGYGVKYHVTNTVPK